MAEERSEVSLSIRVLLTLTVEEVEEVQKAHWCQQWSALALTAWDKHDVDLARPALRDGLALSFSEVGKGLGKAYCELVIDIEGGPLGHRQRVPMDGLLLVGHGCHELRSVGW